MTCTWVFLSLGCLPWALAGQTAIPRESFHDDHFQFAHQIERVAVIGGGGTGLLHAATLIEHGFKVRLFEKQANPGGNWLYNDKAPLPAAFPCVTSIKLHLNTLTNLTVQFKFQQSSFTDRRVYT